MFGLGVFEIIWVFAVLVLFNLPAVLVYLVFVWAVKKRQRDQSSRNTSGEAR
jgi:hypothetical protein